MKVIYDFVHGDECSGPADPCAAVDQDGLGAVPGTTDGPDKIRYISGYI